ncbi:hypothetical protein DM01DRAFT_1075952 [Hesseltinella vesiculosa]|uniref:Uncharacterized protein n=1 Tax=Hesseltinella vesiculosa TaxID=101127 RepID=A0A1X2GW55_9FUNG|nr:hypothetical protein DM01DRAFT_1075952 [Hesseltinella vesiculosa]
MASQEKWKDIKSMHGQLKGKKKKRKREEEIRQGGYLLASVAQKPQPFRKLTKKLNFFFCRARHWETPKRNGRKTSETNQNASPPEKTTALSSSLDQDPPPTVVRAWHRCKSDKRLWHTAASILRPTTWVASVV